jgi:hypothetical protein
MSRAQLDAKFLFELQILVVIATLIALLYSIGVVDDFLQMYLQRDLSNELKLPVRIESVRLLNWEEVEVRGCALLCPEHELELGWARKEILTIDFIYIRVDPFSILRFRNLWHFDEVRFEGVAVYLEQRHGILNAKAIGGRASQPVEQNEVDLPPSDASAAMLVAAAARGTVKAAPQALATAVEEVGTGERLLGLFSNLKSKAENLRKEV